MELKEILQSFSDVHVIDPQIVASDYVAIDLSENNSEISEELVADSKAFAEYITNFLAQNHAKAAFGGYNEKRLLYRRSVFFQSDYEQDRDVHIGLDIWTQAGTDVCAAIDGSVHSFEYNVGNGNYGPTIILKHLVNNHTFYTLYGHLTLSDIEEIEIGQSFAKGDVIGHLGDASVNGDYPPHLHFQVIADIGDHFGDYPGVCSQDDRQIYLDNCPDPNLLLKL